MDVFLLSQNFSKQLKIAKNNYLQGDVVILDQFETYINAFKAIDLNVLDNDLKKKAFFINLYNGFTSYLIIKKGVKKSVKEIPDFFKIPIITLGQYIFSLDDIEHGLLRKNARKHILPNDKRLQFMVDDLDYRIHFALNCGALSCPPIANYTLVNIDAELDLATSVFTTNEFIIDYKTQTIMCSEIFIWYKEDFSNMYLNHPKFKDYSVIKRPYSWFL